MSTSPRMLQAPKQPLVVILGATGTGKSQLAVEIAKRHNGEVINGDAMQLYVGLPVLTNKITKEEQQNIPHHLLGCIELGEPTWVVSTFVKKASQVIEEIRARGRLPILVGGTHYYTQSLLFNEALVNEDAENNVDTSEPPETTWPVLAEPTPALLDRLKAVDPDMAARWHPKDRRKVQRSLMIYLQTGKTASEIYAEQKQAQPTASLRYDPLLFWVHTEQEALRSRLDKRVDKMLVGLDEEVRQLLKHEEKELRAGRTADKTRGIWGAIGYKQFAEYNAAVDRDASFTTREKEQRKACEGTKIATRQYAKRQIRWIRIKLADSLDDAGVKDSLYLLDSTDAAAYDTNVVTPAAQITQQFLAGEKRPLPASLSTIAASELSTERAAPSSHVVRRCESCEVSCGTDQQWTDHLKSKKHRALAKSHKTV